MGNPKLLVSEEIRIDVLDNFHCCLDDDVVVLLDEWNEEGHRWVPGSFWADRTEPADRPSRRNVVQELGREFQKMMEEVPCKVMASQSGVSTTDSRKEDLIPI